jgi:hypothetical protein
MEQMYQDGGITMHVIAVLSALAVVWLVRAGVSARRGVSVRRSGAVLHLVVAIVCTGVFGVVDGFTQVFAALSTVPPEHHALAFARGASIALIPLGWAMLCATPLVLWHGWVQHVSVTGDTPA